MFKLIFLPRTIRFYIISLVRATLDAGAQNFKTLFCMNFVLG